MFVSKIGYGITSRGTITDKLEVAFEIYDFDQTGNI